MVEWVLNWQSNRMNKAPQVPTAAAAALRGPGAGSRLAASRSGRPPHRLPTWCRHCCRCRLALRTAALAPAPPAHVCHRLQHRLQAQPAWHVCQRERGEQAQDAAQAQQHQHRVGHGVGAVEGDVQQLRLVGAGQRINWGVQVKLNLVQPTVACRQVGGAGQGGGMEGPARVQAAVPAVVDSVGEVPRLVGCLQAWPAGIEHPGCTQAHMHAHPTVTPCAPAVAMTALVAGQRHCGYCAKDSTLISSTAHLHTTIAQQVVLGAVPAPHAAQTCQGQQEGWACSPRPLLAIAILAATSHHPPPLALPRTGCMRWR